MAINDTQKAILVATIDWEFSDLAEQDAPNDLKIKALDAIFLPEIPHELLESLRAHHLLIHVEGLRRYFLHSSPQNRATNYTDRYTPDNVPTGHVWWYKSDPNDSYIVCHEAQGLLGLTRFNSHETKSVTKNDVIAYMKQIAKRVKGEINDPSTKEPETEADRRIKEYITTVEERANRAGIRVLSHYDWQKIHLFKRETILSGLIPLPVLLAIDYLILIRRYVPLEALFAQDIIKFEAFNALSTNDQLIINNQAIKMHRDWLGLIKNDQITLQELIQIAGIAEEKLNKYYLPLTPYFSNGCLSFKTYHEFNDNYKSIIVYLLPDKENKDAIKNLIVHLKTLNNNQILQIKNYLDNLSDTDRKKYINERNLFKCIETKIQVLNSGLDKLALDFVKLFNTTTFTDATIINKATLEVKSLAFLWNFHRVNDEDFKAFSFKVKLINKIIEICKKNDKNNKYSEKNHAKQYKYSPDEIRYSDQHSLDKFIYEHASLDNPKIFEFLAKAYPDRLTNIRLEAIKSQFHAHALSAHQQASRDFLLFHLNKPDVATRADYLSYAVDSLTSHIKAPPLDFLLDVRVLASIHHESFEKYFQNEKIMQALLDKSVIIKLDNEQIIALFKKFEEDIKIRIYLENAPRTQSLSLADRCRHGNNLWAELVEAMKYTLLRNTLYKPGDKSLNLKNLSNNHDAMQILSTSTVMIFTTNLLRNTFNSATTSEALMLTGEMQPDQIKSYLDRYHP